jgi:hypothetical protein
MDGVRTEWRWTLQGAIPGDKPFATVVLWMFAVLGVVVVRGFDSPVLELLRKLAVPVDVGEALATAIRLSHGLDLNPEVVMPRHSQGSTRMAV